MDEARRHAWRIDERELARQQARRGRPHAYDTLDARRTALVVVDLVPFFFADNPYVHGIVEPVNALAAVVRRQGGSVAWVSPRRTEPTAWQVSFFGAEIAGRFAATVGDEPVRDRLWPGLEVEDGDLFADKSGPSAFDLEDCDLHEQLAARDVESLVVTGTVTDVCVTGTVRDAARLGYQVVVAADACAAPGDEAHNAALRTIYRAFGDVRSSADVHRLLGD
ncbi:isochorismatase family protein [Nocardioides flavescens]|uniref:Isochorismatase family protein n=1 Tax=Nocardioides flavescens TaxID=2691959 RepID=A0A6L7F4P2_9ACTN|nr:isochorismatase family protein [Nocardioides flavescens]